MIIVYTLVAWVITISLAMLANWMFEEWYDSRLCQLIGIIAIAIAIVCGICTLALTVTSVSWVYTKINLVAVQESMVQRGEVLAELLNFYSIDLAASDVTASEVYKILYEDICDYNYQIIKCNQWKDCWWVEGVFYDPAYLTSTLIPIT